MILHGGARVGPPVDACAACVAGPVGGGVREGLKVAGSIPALANQHRARKGQGRCKVIRPGGFALWAGEVVVVVGMAGLQALICTREGHGGGVPREELTPFDGAARAWPQLDGLAGGAADAPASPVSPHDHCPGLGPVLRGWRRGRALTQREVGDLVGCSDAHVGAVEAERSLLTRAKVRLWTLALNIDFDHGLGRP